MQLWAIASATFRQTIRQAQFWVMIGVGVLLIGLMFFLPFWAEDDDVNMYKDICASFALVVVMISGILSSSRMVEEELEDGTATTVLSKPIRPWHYVTGKFLGISASCALGLLVLGLFICPLTYFKPDMSYHRNPFPPELRMQHVATAAAALPLLMLTVVVMVAIAVAVASRFGIVVNLTVCMMIFVGGRLIWGLRLQQADAGWGEQFAVGALGVLVPNLEYFNMTDTIAYRLQFDWGALWRCVGIESVYALLYCAIALVVAEGLIRRRVLR